MKKANVNILGIYFWGQGISTEMSDKFNKNVNQFCIDNNLPTTTSSFGVIMVKTNEIDIYFHPHQTVIKPMIYNPKYIKEVVNNFVEFLNQSDLPVTIDVNYF